MNPELIIESVNRAPKGGQNSGRISTGVRITHVKTGLVAICDCERSQFKNKGVAMQMIEYGLACIEQTP